MTTFALLLAAAALAYAIATWLKFPAPPLLVGFGVLLNVSGLLEGSEMVNFILLMGVTVLVFVAGAELNPARFARHGIAAAKVGLAQFILLGATGFGVIYLVGASIIEAAYVALAIAASSTFVVVRILKRRRQFYEPFGRMVLGVLLFQDVMVILALAALMRWDEGQLAIESALFRSLALLLVAWMAAKTLVPWLLTKLKLDEEAQLIVVFAILFIFVGAANELDVPLVTGAFCAGFAVSSFPVNSVLRGQLTSFSDFFLALFFTALGAMLVIPSMQTVLLALGLSACVLLFTPLLVTWFAERSGMTAKAAIESGLLLAQTSEFSLIVVLLGAERGHISDEMLAAVALVTVLTMMLTQFIATEANVWRLLKIHPSSFRKQLEREDVENHVIILGVGRNAEALVMELLHRHEDVVIVDQDPVVCDWAEKSGARAIRADASDPRILEQIRAHHAKAVISTLKQQVDNCRIVGELKGIPTIVRAFEKNEVEAIEAAGGIAIPYSEAAADSFISWFDTRFGDAPTTHHPDSSIAEAE